MCLGHWETMGFVIHRPLCGGALYVYSMYTHTITSRNVQTTTVFARCHISKSANVRCSDVSHESVSDDVVHLELIAFLESQQEHLVTQWRHSQDWSTFRQRVNNLSHCTQTTCLYVHCSSLCITCVCVQRIKIIPAWLIVHITSRLTLKVSIY